MKLCDELEAMRRFGAGEQIEDLDPLPVSADPRLRPRALRLRARGLPRWEARPAPS